MHSLKVRTRFNLLREAWLAARVQFPAETQLPQQLDRDMYTPWLSGDRAALI